VAARPVALKGSAYILRNARCAAGRLPQDVDILVERDRLDEVEKALLAAGWEFQKTDAYDQQYYRAWSHELPPMRAPALPLDLDVHHAILPPLGRLRPSSKALFDAAISVADGQWYTLAPPDLVLHVAVHLIQDSDCVNRLRDLVDFDSLVRELAAEDLQFWRLLGERAAKLGLGRPLGYALRLARDWLDTPVESAVIEFANVRPGFVGRAVVLPLAARCLTAVDPDLEPGPADRVARSAMAFRALWLRMPPWLLAYHASHKLLRSHNPGSATRAVS
jgi:hypothetical protein